MVHPIRCQPLRIAEQRSGRSTACEPVADAPAGLYGSERRGFESLRTRPGTAGQGVISRPGEALAAERFRLSPSFDIMCVWTSTPSARWVQGDRNPSRHCGRTLAT